jgi:hypothetical protein
LITSKDKKKLSRVKGKVLKGRDIVARLQAVHPKHNREKEARYRTPLSENIKRDIEKETQTRASKGNRKTHGRAQESRGESTGHTSVKASSKLSLSTFIYRGCKGVQWWSWA